MNKHKRAAGKITVGLVSHRTGPCITDFYGMSTYWLCGQRARWSLSWSARHRLPIFTRYGPEKWQWGL